MYKGRIYNKDEKYTIISVNLFDFEKIDAPDEKEWRNLLDKNNNSVGLMSDLPSLTFPN